ncbi:Patatin-like serine hydrolase [Blumeria hordei DH14]|uniref:Patatin-like phospholipase domain-containing protein n=1 Tax=Blumeria graminis f. sp. hordei (strain DH14) TaxID=546991 RepID=N1JKC9_BLUG1|nr:Patatin-like serine hydrolase [Blumeria hordei DH14]
MADLKCTNDELDLDTTEGFDIQQLPDYDRELLSDEHTNAFVAALGAPEIVLSPGGDELGDKVGPNHAEHAINDCRTEKSDYRSNKDSLITNQKNLFITAQNDWAPVAPTKVSARGNKKSTGRRRAKKNRTSDETREGHAYTLFKWPFLVFVVAWMIALSLSYLLTRLHVWLYEHYINWRGRRKNLRKDLQSTTNFADWVVAANKLDEFLGNELWKADDVYAYYDYKTVRRVLEQIKRYRRKINQVSDQKVVNEELLHQIKRTVEDLKALVCACVKNNFVGVENPRLYSETYFGTKHLVQEFIDEVESGLFLLENTPYLNREHKRALFKRLYTNYGRTALCLSGGASFAYYHFGVVKALLDADLLPDVITGTSGGALVAAMVATHTNDELKKLLVPALAEKISACSEPFRTWFPRWWKTGARFDSVDWAKRCSWFTRGSLTFSEAYDRTGRILNVSCVPADPHSPTILANYITSPDCVIWSAVLASAAVPGILNPVVLMMKTQEGKLIPYSFGHKWKDGSLRTDIPLKALNLHFNVNFSIVSQVNPHINLFFFSSRGAVGQPVTHRKGRGWRGGFLGSALEQYLKLDLNKWLKVIRALELLPRPLGQDWSEIWLQQFSGTITIWPRTVISDFWRILSDPDPKDLARMLHVGQQSAYPKLKFIENRLRIERTIERARRATRAGLLQRSSIDSIISKASSRATMRLLEELGTEDEGSITAEGEETENEIG